MISLESNFVFISECTPVIFLHTWGEKIMAHDVNSFKNKLKSTGVGAYYFSCFVIQAESLAALLMC